MKGASCWTIIVLLAFNARLMGQQPNQGIWNYEETKNVMEDAYWSFWDEDEQRRIDEAIDRNRKADAVITLESILAGSEVEIEQVGHTFLFGGNIFLFGNFDTPQQNSAYESTFGTLFNAATVPFYWKTLEPEKGKPRYKAGAPDIYRRPPPDPVVAFCESKQINMNGHAIIYGSRKWGHPDWMPEDRNEMETLFEQHVKALAERYSNRIQRWDVVNESIHQADRGLMPDDYTYKTFAWAKKYFPDDVKFNSNDCDIKWGPTPRYVEIVRDLIDRGVSIDNVGVQMHIFDPSESQKIAQGADVLTPEKNYAVLNCLDGIERPIHISEVTVSAPDESHAGQLIQAVIARNLYRLWFSYPSTMGITWWNVVDGGAAPGEPSLSGLYDKELNPKPVYYALDQLINQDWKTRITVTAQPNGVVEFRGFKGAYRIKWRDARGNDRQAAFSLEKDGSVQLRKI